MILHHDASGTGLSLYAVDVLLGDDVPGRHVLFHALRVAGRFARGQGGTGLGDAALEAVFVEFLMRRGLARVGKEWKSWIRRYLDKLSCVGDGGFLCDLLLDGLSLAGARSG